MGVGDSFVSLVTLSLAMLVGHWKCHIPDSLCWVGLCWGQCVCVGGWGGHILDGCGKARPSSWCLSTAPRGAAGTSVSAESDGLYPGELRLSEC